MTYSIVARDPETGALGVAVQSHYFAAGQAVPWAEAGVGAVATQSVVDVGYGPRGLDRMRAGADAPTALAELVGDDPMEAVRQVAFVDATGAVATHTGAGCVAHAGHRSAANVTVQANMMLSDTVPDAMLAAYTTSAGDLAERLLAALEAAEGEGGDIRGRQSAAILIVSGECSESPWDSRLVDLRVDDHPEPLSELRRLVELNRAFQLVAGVFYGGLLFAPEVAPDDPVLQSALRDLATAQAAIGQDNLEPTFWQAALLGKAGRIEEARALLERATAGHAHWPEFLRRIAGIGILAVDSPLLVEPAGV